MNVPPGPAVAERYLDAVEATTMLLQGPLDAVEATTMQ
jgi:hypothetical protein